MNKFRWRYRFSVISINIRLDSFENESIGINAQLWIKHHLLGPVSKELQYLGAVVYYYGDRVVGEVEGLQTGQATDVPHLQYLGHPIVAYI